MAGGMRYNRSHGPSPPLQVTYVILRSFSVSSDTIMCMRLCGGDKTHGAAPLASKRGDATNRSAALAVQKREHITNADPRPLPRADPRALTRAHRTTKPPRTCRRGDRRVRDASAAVQCAGRHPLQSQSCASMHNSTQSRHDAVPGSQPLHHPEFEAPRSKCTTSARFATQLTTLPDVRKVTRRTINTTAVQ